MNDDSNISEIKREGGRFVKGQSGNPRGGNKPRLFRDYDGQRREIGDLFREGAPAVVERLMRTIFDVKTPESVRVNAMKLWLERSFGKPAITIQPTEQIDYEGIDFANMSEAALDEILRLAPQNGAK